MTKEKVQEAFKAAGHIHANNNEVLEDVAKLISRYEADANRRPYYIYCAATGAKLGMSQMPVFQNRLDSFNGDMLRMFAEYKGRSSKPKSERNVVVGSVVHRPPPIRTGIVQEMETLATDKNGNPTKQAWNTYVNGKLVNKVTRNIEPETITK